jgi:hypothetical protein
MSTLFLFVTSLLAPTAQAGKPPQDTRVTSSFAGFGIDTVPTMRLQSDQLGPYVNTSTVLSHIQGSGDYELITNSASTPTRTVLFDFRDSIPNSAPGGTNPTPPFPHQKLPSRLICKGGAYATDMQEMYGVGTIGYCALSPSFSYTDGSRYRIDMGTPTFPGTQPALITCVRVDPANKCNQWRVEPSGVQANGERKNLGRLMKTIPAKPKDIHTSVGDFYFSFTIDNQTISLVVAIAEKSCDSIGAAIPS